MSDTLKSSPIMGQQRERVQNPREFPEALAQRVLRTDPFGSVAILSAASLPLTVSFELFIWGV